MLDFCFFFNSLYDGMVIMSIIRNKSDSACLRQSKYIILSHIMEGISIRCFWLLDYAGANVNLLNGLCFVQIQQAIMEIFSKNPAQGNFLILSIFDL